MDHVNIRRLENVDPTITVTDFLIDKASLNKCSYQENVADFACLGSTVTSLRIRGITEEGVDTILPVFKHLESLTLERLIISKGTCWNYPINLKHLSLIDCKVSGDLVLSWFTRLSHTLRHIEITRSYFNINLDNMGSLAEPEFLSLLTNLRTLRITDDRVIKFSSSSIPATLKEISLDVPTIPLKYIDCKSTLESLTLRSCPKFMYGLTKLENLRSLRIINPVSETEMEELKKLQSVVVNLDIHCSIANAENLILMLDNDSLIHILSYLTIDDWIAMRQIDERLNRIVMEFMFPTAQVVIDDAFEEKYPVEDNHELYCALGRSVRKLSLSCNSLIEVLPFFVNLTSLYIPHRTKDVEWMKDIPDSLQHLNLFVHRENQNLEPLFQRLDDNLTSLEICGPFKSSHLTQLHNIRQIKLGGFCPTTINLMGFMKQNEDHLESLEINFYPSDMGMSSDEEAEGEEEIVTDFELCPLKRLKTLRLGGLQKPLTILSDHYPSLKELNLGFDTYANRLIIYTFIDNIRTFANLKVLHINHLPDYKMLYPLQKLQCLEIFKENVDEEMVLNIVSNLPTLREIGTENRNYSLAFLVRVEDILKTRHQNSILLYHCKWPQYRMRLRGWE